MKKAIIAIALAAAFLGGCSKSSDSGTSSDAASPAAEAVSAAPASAESPAAAATAAAAATTAAGESTAVAVAASSAPATSATAAAGEATVATSAASAAATGAAPAAETAATIELPVYPGATEQADKGVAMTTGTTSLKMQVLETKTDAKTVIDWYKAHLPSSWQNFTLSNEGKTVGTFSSETAGGQKSAAGDQSVIVSSDNGVTRIQLTTKKGN